MEPSWGGLGAVLAASGRVDGASSGVLGRLGASFRGLEPDFRTKLRHSILDAILDLIFTKFSSFFRVF